MKLFSPLRRVVLATSFVLAGVGAQAAELEGLRFDDQTQLANQNLKLNGLGLRSVFIIRAYVAGLYLTEKSSSAQDILQNPGPKRLQLRPLMELSSGDIKKALIDGVRKNVGEAQWPTFQERAAALARTIDTIGSSRPGEVIALDYLPGKGLLLSINDSPKGPPVPGADFYAAVLEIFIGNNPVDGRLKKGLLGQ
jgi:hypothetical protein